MKYRIICFVIALTCSQYAMASPLDNTTHTYTQHTLELKPISSQYDSYQIASMNFLPNFKDSEFGWGNRVISKNYNRGDCNNKSSLFTTSSCSYPKAVVASSRCSTAPQYYRECVCQPQFKLTSCISPKYASHPSCDGKFESCLCPSTVNLTYPNDKCTSYCDSKCIKKTCTPTASETGCSYGTNTVTNNCGGTRTVCKPCNLTPCSEISSKPANSYYLTKSCTDCAGTTTINYDWACDSGYSKSGNTCVKNCTPLTNETGCKYGTTSCTNGCGGTRTCCSGCSVLNCTSLNYKPANSYYLTKSCTDCAGTTTINYGWSCNFNYSKSGNICVKNCTPLNNETGCKYGTTSCTNGCGGTRTCCSAEPACTPKTTASCADIGFVPMYREGKMNVPDGCGGTISCPRKKSCEESCSNQECIDNCYMYEAAGDQCWWNGCLYD